MKANEKTKSEIEKSDEIKPEKDVLREPGQISFKDALKKAIIPKKKKK